MEPVRLKPESVRGRNESVSRQHQWRVVRPGSGESPKRGSWEEQLSIRRDESSVKALEGGGASSVGPSEGPAENGEVGKPEITHDPPELQHVLYIRQGVIFVLRRKKYIEFAHHSPNALRKGAEVTKLLEEN